jgi:hypothetical protein
MPLAAAAAPDRGTARRAPPPPPLATWTAPVQGDAAPALPPPAAPAPAAAAAAASPQDILQRSKEERLAEIFTLLDWDGEGSIALPAAAQDVERLARQIGSARVARLVVPVLQEEARRRPRLTHPEFRELLMERFRGRGPGGDLPWPILLAEDLARPAVRWGPPAPAAGVALDGGGGAAPALAGRRAGWPGSSPPPVPARSFAYRQQGPPSVAQLPWQLSAESSSSVAAGTGGDPGVLTRIGGGAASTPVVVEADVIVKSFKKAEPLGAVAPGGSAGRSQARGGPCQHPQQQQQQQQQQQHAADWEGLDGAGRSREGAAGPGPERRAQERLAAMRRLQREREMANCTFQPRINPPGAPQRAKGQAQMVMGGRAGVQRSYSQMGARQQGLAVDRDGP